MTNDIDVLDKRETEAATIATLREEQAATFAMLVKLESEMSDRWFGDFTSGNHDVRCLYCGFSQDDKDDILCENPDCAMVQARVFISALKKRETEAAEARAGAQA